MKTNDNNELMPFGARPILPPLEYDHPLSPEEIKPAFASPVIYLGVNLTAYASCYLERIHHIKTTADAPLPDLGCLLQNEKQYELQTNLTC